MYRAIYGGKSTLMHLFEPYNAYAPKKKRDWRDEQREQQEIAELEARLLEEARRNRVDHNQQSIDTVDQTQAQTVGDAGTTVTAGSAAGAGMGGPAMDQNFLHPSVDTNSLDFTASIVSGTGSFVLTATVTGAGNEYVSYLWDFGDGTTGTGNPVSHEYTATGSYDIQVTGSNPQGEFSTGSVGYLDV